MKYVGVVRQHQNEIGRERERERDRISINCTAVRLRRPSFITMPTCGGIVAALWENLSIAGTCVCMHGIVIIRIHTVPKEIYSHDDCTPGKEEYTLFTEKYNFSSGATILAAKTTTDNQWNWDI